MFLKIFVFLKNIVSSWPPILVNRGWVPRDWRDKNVQDHQGVREVPEYKEADKKTDGKGSWWKFWSNSKEPEQSCEVILHSFICVVSNLLLKNVNAFCFAHQIKFMH
jgi:hypothetical protein